MGSTTFFFLLSLLIAVSADNTLIENTCKSTKYSEICLSILKSNTKSSNNADTKGLALIVIGVGKANATATSSYWSSLSADDTVLNGVLKECAVKYTNAGDALQNSVQDLASENYDYAIVDVTAAADYPNACHNAFKRNPGLVYSPEIARREEGLKQICDVILGIIKQLV